MRTNTTDKRLKMLLSNLGMTQKELSQKSNVSEAAISKYLNGSRIPNAQSIIQIAEATKVSPSWILGYGSDYLIEGV